MTSLLKTFYNNKLLHENIKNRNIPEEIRFTKVLTKYSTEYNNSTFLQNLCQKLNIGLSDLKLLMITLKNNHSMEEIYKKLEMYDFNKFGNKPYYAVLQIRYLSILIKIQEVLCF